jgi:hypothetical protein
MRYDYSKSVYIRHDSDIIIICSVHGEFLQRPANHLNGNGCPYCNKKKSSLSIFVEKSKFYHGERYDYSKTIYESTNKKVEIVCKKHGSFYVSPHNHLGYEKQGCSRCHIDDKLEKFISRSNNTHGNKYDYSEFIFVTGHTRGTIICPYHGRFTQTPDVHRTAGCRKCNSVGVYNLSYFTGKNRNITGNLYLIKVSNTINSFYKIGITKRIISKRINSFRTTGYSVETLFETNGYLRNLFIIEQYILKNIINSCIYYESPVRDGNTECFITNTVTIDTIINYIRNENKNERDKISTNISFE